MYAIIATGGKQYRVSEGDVIYIEKIDAQVDSTVSFDVLLMGNDGDVKIGTPVVEGVKELNGAPVRAHDLRAGAAMVIAGLAAKGVTEVEQVQNIERGYETLVEKFVALGADMYRSEIPESAENK